ncbi:MAG: methyltransferase type 11 [Euryarchaeota archaeon]|nr:methyltransferase type 11 [Euryarchaeota archaeon]|tara:strand:- start:7772 stop:8608 length:837 start_codon:yes stop_codon:yes gene_type:complete
MRVTSPKKMGLPARSFVTLLRFAPSKVQNRMWKWWYQKLAKANDQSEFRFMNYGFEDGDGPKLDAEDEPNRTFIQLYSMNIRGVDLEGRDVLEVGSGRGGGASWIAKTHSPARLVGVDFSPEAVRHCKRWYANQTNLEFIEGNAQDLPFEDESFDVVYNVESSHCYGDMAAFIEQANRILRPGGLFCWTDLRDSETMASLPALFQSKGFEIVESSNVVQEVIKALDEVNEQKMKAIEDNVPKSARRSFETFAGVKGTPVYEGFVTGSMAYRRILMRKA